MRIIGGLLIAFGLVDMIGSFTGLDVWGEWIRVGRMDSCRLARSHLVILSLYRNRNRVFLIQSRRKKR